MDSNLAQKLKRHIFIAPQAIADNTAWTSTVFDTQGVTSLTVEVIIGATDIAFAALKVQEADAKTDATTLTSGTDITGADFSVSGTLPSATADNTIVSVTIPITGLRKRYINVSATAGNGAAGTFAAAIGYATMQEVPGTATQCNLGQQLIVAG